MGKFALKKQNIINLNVVSSALRNFNLKEHFSILYSVFFLKKVTVFPQKNKKVCKLFIFYFPVFINKQEKARENIY